MLYDCILATGSWDFSLRIWDCDKGVCNHVIACMLDCLVKAKEQCIALIRTLARRPLNCIRTHQLIVNKIIPTNNLK